MTTERSSAARSVRGVRARATQGERVRVVRASRIEANRRGWDHRAAAYQKEVGGRGMYRGEITWGPNRFRDDEVGVLGDVNGLDVLEIGCGAAQFGIELARRGANVLGVDLSAEQLRHARRNIKAAGVSMRVMRGNAERLTRVRTGSFDIVVSDFAAGFMDLNMLLPEIHRVLRPGGFCALSWTSPIMDCLTGDGSPPLLQLRYSYFDRTPWVDGGRDSTWEFKRTYGDWVRAFAGSGLVLEDLAEPQTPKGGSHGVWPQFRWQRTSQIPGTCIWKARKPDR